MKTKKHQEFLFYIFAMILPVLFSTLWLLKNTQLPVADATDYLTTGHQIYSSFADNGLWRGFLNFYTLRGWRPILFPIFTVPFLFVSHGNITFTFIAVAISCVIASATYVYLFSRLKLDRLSSLIVVNLICLLPFFQAPVLTFFAEAVLFPAVIGTLYHLVQSNYFQNKKHTLGFCICFSLAILIRPVEAVTGLIFVVILFLATGWYRQIFSLKQIVSVVVIGLSALYLFLCYVSLYFIHHFPFQPIDGGKYDIKLAKSIYTTTRFSMIAMLISVGSFALISYMPWCRKRCIATGKPINDPPVIFVFLCICALVFIWFLPYSFQTYTWIFRTSFGDLANIPAPLIKPSMLSVIYARIIEESLLMVVGATVVALLAALTIGKQRLRNICFFLPVIYLLLLAPFSIWEILNTVQTGARKLSIAYPAIILALLLIGLQRGRTWLLRCVIVTGLLIFQFVYSINVIYSGMFPFNFYKNLMGVYPVPITLQPNPHNEIVKFLQLEVDKYHYKNVIAMLNAQTNLPVDPFLLCMMNRTHKETYTFVFPYISSYSDINMANFNQPGNAIFVADRKENMIVSKMAAKVYYQRFENATVTNTKMLYRYLYFYTSNQLESIGWKLGSCMNMKANDGNEYQGCLLVRNDG